MNHIFLFFFCFCIPVTDSLILCYIILLIAPYKRGICKCFSCFSMKIYVVVLIRSVSEVFSWKKNQKNTNTFWLKKRKPYLELYDYLQVTVNILIFRTPKFLTKCRMQTVQTQIRLLLKEQSDQGLHCLPFH